MSLSLSVWRPTIVASGSNVAYTPRGTKVGDFKIATDGNEDAHLRSWRHTVKRFGGFWDAATNFDQRFTDIDWWLTYGLGCHCELVDPDSDIAFECFVNKVLATRASEGGTETINRGPLLDIANRVSVIYTPIDTDVDPPARGMPTPTTAADNDASKTRWGIREVIMQYDAATQAAAEQFRDMHLYEMANPKYEPSGETRSGVGRRSDSLSLELAGYVRFLEGGIYYVTTTGLVYLSTKLTDIVDDTRVDPNALFDSDNASIESNQTLVVEAADHEDAMSAIRALVEAGNPTNDLPANFGVYEGRKIIYETIPQTFAYRRQRSYSGDVFDYVSISPIAPWKVRPGRWMFVGEFDIGRAVPDPADAADDPRVVFLEEVTFTAPRQFSYQQGTVSKLKQRIARAALGAL